MTGREFSVALDGIFSKELSCSWDNDGVMCLTEPERPIRKVLLTLDITMDAVKEAEKTGCDLVISHHPLIFSPLRHWDVSDPVVRILCRLTEKHMAAFSYHTRLDAAEGGVNDCLCSVLGFSQKTPLSYRGDTMARLCTLEPISAMKLAHFVKNKLGASEVSCTLPDKVVTKAVVIGGSGKDFIDAAIAVGADALITGEVSYNAICLAADNGLAILCAGHFYTENPVLSHLESVVHTIDPAVETVIFHSNLIRSV